MTERDGGAPPRRPTIAVPPSRYSMDGEGGGGAAWPADVSPGPMALVSSFFADDPDLENRSFSRVLAGAIDSPVAALHRTLAERDSGGGEGMDLRNLLPLVAVPLCQSSFEPSAGLSV